MTDYNWCHGPECHTRHTVDRVRGVKGSKVLRTRKIKLNQWNSRGAWSLFCSQGCYNDFFHKYVNEIVAIAPRTECLETPIHQPTKEQNEYGWINWEIKVDESRQIDQDNPINRKVYMKTLKKEYQRGGSKRQEVLDKAVDYIATGPGLQADKHAFCINNLMMNETEYLECLNKATNGGLVAEALWN